MYCGRYDDDPRSLPPCIKVRAYYQQEENVACRDDVLPCTPAAGRNPAAVPPSTWLLEKNITAAWVVQEQRALGRAMHYEMHYNLRVLRPEEEVPAPPDDATDDSHAPSSSATTPPAAPGSSSGASTSSAQSQPTRVSP